MLRVLRKINSKVNGIAYGIIVLVIIFAIIEPKFISERNIENIFKNAAILTIVAMGMTLAILSGQIDLSIGSVMSLSSVVVGMIVKMKEDPSALWICFAVLVGLAVGVVIGLFNGIMIGKYKYDFWLITFSSLAIAKSIALVITNGSIISGYTRLYRNIGDGDILGVQTSIWFAVVICGIMIWISTRTRYGYALYAVGNSEQCAHQTGINVVKTRIKTYVLSGLLAAAGGVLLASKTNSATSILGSGYEFNAIAAVLVGGTPFAGGKGGLSGTVLGSLLLAIMKSGLQIIKLSVNWQMLLIGVFIMIIIIADTVRTRFSKTKEQRRVYKDA